MDLSIEDGLLGREVFVGEGARASADSVRCVEFSVEASVREPSPGYSIGINLGSGLRLVEGERSQLLRDGATNLRWRVGVDVAAAPGRLRYSAALRSAKGRVVSSVTRDVNTVAVGRTVFDPAVDGFAFSNKPGLFGSSLPPRSVFDGTYRGGLNLYRSKLYEGLYHSVFQAGLCTGMARAALWLATSERLGKAADRTADDEATREIIQLLHGRQLSDRALLSSAYAILFCGPRKTFRKFREQVLTAGRSPIAIDVGVPKVTRTDFLRAVVRQGHTVVPYAYELRPGNRARIYVYDPVFPSVALCEERLAIEIDLAANSYRYRGWSSDDSENRTTILGVPLSAYTDGTTAYIASLAAMVGIK